jgi:TP901 family phage tail tape measure protein
MSKQFVLPAVFTAIDKFSGPVNKMASSAETSMARMERKFRNVGATAFDVSRKSAMLATSIIAPLGLVANEAVKFEKSMSNISTLVDTNTESMQQMGEKVLAMAGKLPVPIDELTASLYDIRSAGVPANRAMATLESSAKLSSAGLSTVSESTNILTSAMNAFVGEGKSAGEISDILFKTVKFGKTTVAELSQAFGASAPIMQSAGVTLADFSAATAALTTLGTPASQAQNQLKASMVSLMKPAKNMNAVFKQLGVSSGEELIKKYGNLGNSFAAVNAAAKKLNVTTGDVWGSTEALAGVTALTTSVNGTYATTLGDMENGQNAVNGAFEKQGKTGAASMQKMKNNLQSLAITLGNAVLPLISDLVSAITPVIQSMSRWMSENKSTVKIMVTIAAVVGGVAAAISAVSFVVGIASKAFGIYKAITQAAAVATQVITAVQWAWNAAMMANPIGAIIVAVGALAVGVYALTKAFSMQTSAEKLSGEVRSRALESTLDLRVETTMLFATLRKAEKGSDAFNASLARLEEIQPGIIAQFNLMEGKLNDINAAEKALTASIMARGEAEARAELIKEKLKEAQILKDEGPGWMDQLVGATSGVDANAMNELRVRALRSEANTLAEQQADAEMKKQDVVNPKATETKSTVNTNKSSKQTVDINVNAPEGTTVKGSGSGPGVKLKTTRN